MGSFFDELKRRNVVRVGVAYLVVAWLVAQVAELVLPTFGAPDWVLRTLLVLMMLGLPFALLFSWAFELTPEGLKRTAEVDASASVTHSTGRKLDFFIIGVLVVALGYFVWESRFAPAPDATQQAADAAMTPGRIAASLAVLPFVNLSSDTEQSWFADGLTEEILNSLVRIPDLLIAARTSSFVYKGTDKTVPEIATELGVSHVLEGSVRRAGERLRVTAQLIRAEDGFHLWSETYDRTMDDVIRIQEEVALEIAKALKTAMDPEALERMVAAGTRSVAAYEAFLEGVSLLRQSNSSGDPYVSLEGRTALERAVEIDPEFSDAYARLAGFWNTQLRTTDVNFGIADLPREEIQGKFNEAIDNAIRTEADPIRQAGKRAFKAATQLNYADAIRYNEKFLSSRPNDFLARGQRIGLLTIIGQYRDAAELARDTMSMEQDTLGFSNDATFSMLWGASAEEVREAANEAIRRFDDDATVLYQAHRGLLWSGDIDGASRIIPILDASDLPADNKLLVRLRQACAERRLDDAQQVAASLLNDFDDLLSARWLTYMILGDADSAVSTIRPLDDPTDLSGIADFLAYGIFDPRPFPNLMAHLERQGIDRGAPIELPYRCNR